MIISIHFVLLKKHILLTSHGGKIASFIVYILQLFLLLNTRLVYQ